MVDGCEANEGVGMVRRSTGIDRVDYSIEGSEFTVAWGKYSPTKSSSDC